VIARRAKAANDGPLFPELKPGGTDGKLSHEASKAFGRRRRASGIPDGPDFHSLRRQVATILERAGVVGVPLDRFLGHKTGNLATDVYSEGSDAKQALATAQKVVYSRKVEAAARALSSAFHRGGE
jgi:integrase